MMLKTRFNSRINLILYTKLNFKITHILNYQLALLFLSKNEKLFVFGFDKPRTMYEKILRQTRHQRL